MIKQVAANAGLGLGDGILSNIMNGKPPFADVKSLLITTFAGAMGPILGGKVDKLSVATKSAVNATFAFGTGVLDNVANGRKAFADIGTCLAVR